MKRMLSSLICIMVFGIAGPLCAADTIKIGVAGPHSGDLASYGLPSLNAVQLVVNDINAGGGINGKKIDLVKMDDVCKPEVAVNTAQKMVSEKVVAVIGHICSGATKTALPIYKDANVIAISPSATKTDLTTSGNFPNFFRTIGSDKFQAQAIVDFVLNNLKLKTFAIIHDKGDYGEDVAQFAKEMLEAKGAKVLLFEGVTAGAVDYSAIVRKIRHSKAQAVIYGGYHPEGAKIVMGMRRRGMRTAFISDDGLKDDAFIKVAKDAAEGVYATGPSDTSNLPLAVEAVEKHRKMYGADPGAFYLNAYAAIEALVNALEKSGSTDCDVLSKTLRTQWVDTVLGKISFDDKGDAKGIGFSMYTVQDGKYVEVK